jgi:hypothetical protein
LKLAKTIARYFYQAQAMNINGLGTFTSAPSGDPDNPAPIIQFTYKPTVANDDGLVKFIVTETGKMRPLAESDLESFVTSGLQLLNIGKPFFIEGLGAIQRNKEGVWDFITGNQISEKASYDIEEERKLRGDLHEVPQRRIVDAEANHPESSGGLNWKRILLSLGVLAVLGGGAFALYKYVLQPQQDVANNVNTSNDNTGINKDTTSIQKDTSAIAKPKPLNTMVTIADGKLAYNMVYKVLANKADADKYMANDIRFDSIKVQVAPLDTTKYKAFIPLKTLAADTGRIRKRVISFFKADSNAVYIER